MDENNRQGELTREEKNNAVFGGGETMQGMAPIVDDVPFETVPLPSEGKVYGEGHPLNNKKTVDIRVMTAREEDILTSRALIKKGTVITELLRSCIMEPGIDVQDMVAGDRNAIMVALRITGYGPGYSAEIECSSCGDKYDNEFNLGSLPLKKLELEPIKDGENLFEFDLPFSKKKVEFKFLSGKDEEDINIVQEKMKKLGQMRDTLVTTRLKRSIVSLDGDRDKAKIANFVDRHMRAGDSRALRKYIEKQEPGMIMRQDAHCSHCGAFEEVTMPLGVNFFWPE